MKAVTRIFIVFIIIAVLFAFPAGQVNAQIQVPETIKVGLYFRDTSEHMDTALTVFNASADNGINAGVLLNGAFILGYEELTPNTVSVAKEGYYSYTGTKPTVIDPSQAQTAQGIIIGPYHIKLGPDYTDAVQAKAQIEIYKQAGIKAYLAFTGCWQIWSGSFIDETASQQGISVILQTLPNEQAALVQPTQDRIIVLDPAGDMKFIFGGGTGVFRLQPGKDNNPFKLKINGKPYRGELEVRRFSQSDMTVINVLPLEQYLYGVVPSEIEASSNPEAIKAQAVAARTYAMNSMKSHSSIGFDICPTTYAQVYKGVAVEAPASNKAVDDTKGKLVVYQGKPAAVFYFSSSGGRTEDVNNVWKSDIPYLKSVDDSYESGKSWKYLWNVTYTADKIKSIMLGRNYDLGDITSVRITATSAAGRATQLVISGTKNSRVYEKGACRSVFSDFYSQWYTITTDADVMALRNDGITVKTQAGGRQVMTTSGLKSVSTANRKISIIGANGAVKTYSAVASAYTFSGRGNGHAIGLSQEGAKGMAKAGFTCEQIIAHYFTGANVE